MTCRARRDRLGPSGRGKGAADGGWRCAGSARSAPCAGADVGTALGTRMTGFAAIGARRSTTIGANSAVNGSGAARASSRPATSTWPPVANSTAAIGSARRRHCHSTPRGSGKEESGTVAANIRPAEHAGRTTKKAIRQAAAQAAKRLLPPAQPSSASQCSLRGIRTMSDPCLFPGFGSSELLVAGLPGGWLTASRQKKIPPAPQNTSVMRTIIIRVLAIVNICSTLPSQQPAATVGK